MQRLALLTGKSRPLVSILLFGIALMIPAGRAVAGPVVGAKKSKVYHSHPKDCPAAKNINDANIMRWASEEEALKEGRRLCKTCAKLDEKAKNKSSEPEEPDRPSKKKAAGDSESEPKGDDSRPPVEFVDVRVKKVSPGGTLWVDNGDKVRIVGVLIPQAGQPLADETVRFIQKLLKGRKVQVAPLADGEGEHRRDPLGRMVAFVSAGSGDADLGGELITEGLAAVDRSQEFSRLDDYLKREDDAAWAGRGIWKKPDGPDGDEAVVMGKYTHAYHSPDCPHVVHLIEPATMTVNEAKGRRCFPCEYFHLEHDGKKK